MTVCILFLSQANICILENISMPWFQIFHLTWYLNFLKIILLARNSRHLKLFEPRVYTKEPAKQLFNLYNWRRLCVFRQYCNPVDILIKIHIIFICICHLPFIFQHIFHLEKSFYVDCLGYNHLANISISC